MTHFIEQGAASERAGRNARLNALMRFAEVRDCRRVPLLAYFGEELKEACGHCDNCAQKPHPEEQMDVTAEARKFLSCVQMTGELFGPAHIIAVLRGSKSEKVLARRHERLSVYGTGREHSTEAWRELAAEFLQQGLLEQDLQFGGLRLTGKGREVLAGKGKILVAASAKAPPTPEPAQAAEGRYDADLFERLRRLRRELADGAGLPAYMVLSDRALVEMATYLPRTEEQLLAVNGVGEAKLAKYGKEFLAEIRAHVERQGENVASCPRRATTPAARRRRYHEVGERFASGETIEAIARQHGVKNQTILQHLRQFVESGGVIEPERILAFSRLSVVDRERVVKAFEQHGLEWLSPVHEALGGAIDYEELHTVQLYLLSVRSGHP